MEGDSNIHAPARKVFVARHGERIDHVDPTWAATAPRPFDPPLTDRGQAQARCLARRLQNENIHKIVCSPYIRTIQTANAVAELLDLPLYLDYGIQEWFGDSVLVDERQPLQPEELKDMFPRIDTSYEAIHPRVSGYEDSLRVHWRLWNFVSKALDSERLGGNVLFVGHAATTIACSRAVYSLNFDSVTLEHFHKNGPSRILVNAGYCSIVRLDHLPHHPEKKWHVHTRGAVDHMHEDPVALGNGSFANWWYLEDRDRAEADFVYRQ